MFLAFLMAVNPFAIFWKRFKIFTTASKISSTFRHHCFQIRKVLFEEILDYLVVNFQLFDFKKNSKRDKLFLLHFVKYYVEK